METQAEKSQSISSAVFQSHFITVKGGGRERGTYPPQGKIQHIYIYLYYRYKPISFVFHIHGSHEGILGMVLLRKLSWYKKIPCGLTNYNFQGFFEGKLILTSIILFWTPWFYGQGAGYVMVSGLFSWIKKWQLLKFLWPLSYPVFNKKYSTLCQKYSRNLWSFVLPTLYAVNYFQCKTLSFLQGNNWSSYKQC